MRGALPGYCSSGLARENSSQLLFMPACCFTHGEIMMITLLLTKEYVRLFAVILGASPSSGCLQITTFFMKVLLFRVKSNQTVIFLIFCFL